jgi:hypothetical protein
VKGSVDSLIIRYLAEDEPPHEAYLPRVKHAFTRPGCDVKRDNSREVQLTAFGYWQLRAHSHLGHRVVKVRSDDARYSETGLDSGLSSMASEARLSWKSAKCEAEVSVACAITRVIGSFLETPA